MSEDHIPLDAFGDAMMKMLMERLRLDVSARVDGGGVSLTVTMYDAENGEKNHIQSSTKIVLVQSIPTPAPPILLMPG